MANSVVEANEVISPQLESIASAIKAHVDSPQKVSQLTQLLQRASEAKGGDISLKDFLRTVGDSDIKKYSLGDMEVDHTPAPPQRIVMTEPVVTRSSTRSEPASGPWWHHKMVTIPLAIVVILVVVVGVMYLRREGTVEKEDSACPRVCDVECESLNELSIAKCVKCDHTKACNPRAKGFVLPGQSLVSSQKDGAKGDRLKSTEKEGVVDPQQGSVVDPQGAMNSPSTIDPTQGINIHVRIGDGVSITQEDRIVFSSLSDASQTVQIFLKELEFVNNTHTLSLPEPTYFATARTIGTRAHFQSSGVVQDGAVIRFGPSAVEVNAHL